MIKTTTIVRMKTMFLIPMTTVTTMTVMMTTTTMTVPKKRPWASYRQW